MRTIGVIVPVYNAEKYLVNCIESILSQTYRNLLLILIDDGSTDNSGKICDEYRKKDQRVYVIHQKNSGQSVARNKGLNFLFSNCEFDYIGFVDSDDFIHPQMYECLYNILSDNDANMSICSYMDVKIDPNHNYKMSNFLDISKFDYEIIDKREALKRLFISDNDRYGLVMPKLYKKNLFEKRRFIEGVIYEDVASCYKVLYDANSIAVTNNKLYFYNYNPESTTKKKYTKERLYIIIAMEDQIKFLKEKKYMDVYRLAIQKYLYLLTYHGNLAHRDLNDILIDKMIYRKLRTLFWKEFIKCKITPLNSPDCYNTLFPKMMKLYWYAYGIFRRMKNDT